MALFSIEPSQPRTRLISACALSFAVALIAGCGSTYRPVVTPVSPSGPAAQPNSLVAVISGTSASAPGTATIIDYSGDDIMAQAPIGVGPRALTVDSPGSTGYTYNSDGTITSFPVSTTLHDNYIQSTTLSTTTQITGLFSPNTGLWASDLDKNVADNLTGSPVSFNLAVPVAPIPIAVVGTKTGARNYAISQNNQNTPAGSVLPYGVDCNESPFTVTQTGEADAIENTPPTVSVRIPLGKCPVFGVASADGYRVFVLNRGDDTVTVIDSNKNALDSCQPGVNQNGQAFTCHPTLPLSLTAVRNTGITPLNGTSGMTSVAGPVYAEYVAATNQLVVANYNGSTISVIDVSLDQYQNDGPNFGTTYTISVGKNPASVTVLPPGDRAYTADQTDGTVTVADLIGHTVKTKIPVNGHPRTVVSTANSLYGKVYVGSPDSPLLSIIRTDLDIKDTTVTVPGNIVDVRVSTQNGTPGNTNLNSRMPGAGQPCYLPPSLEPAPTAGQTALQVCQTLP